MDLAQRLEERTLELCRIPSPYGDETAIADHLEKWARERWPAEKVLRHGNALVVGPLGEAGKPRIALVGHLDTVPASGDTEPHVEGPRLVGLGASDMKGGLAVAMALLEDLPAAGTPYELVGVFYDKEEGPHEDSGLRPLLEHHPSLLEADLAIVMEPTDNVVQVGCVGSIHATITFHGRAAHAARPWFGENAITRAGTLLAELDERAPVEVNAHGQVFREVMTVTLAEGGRYRNVVPDRFVLNLNYRFAPGRSLDEACQDIEALVAGRADVAYTDRAPSGAVPEGNAILDHLIAESHLELEPKQAWTDVARLTEAGIDAVNFGPGLTAQAHQAGEFCEVRDLERAYQALSQLVLEVGA